MTTATVEAKTLGVAKILLVDDLESNLLALGELLRGEDVDVLCARSGREALELLLAHTVALAVVDVQMPGMDGFELAELMRGVARTHRVPIIFVTAGAQDRERRFRGYEAGAVDFLYKPVDPDVLRGKARVFIDLHRHAQALAEQRDALRNALAEKSALLAERAETEARLRRSETRYRALVSASARIVWRAGLDGGALAFSDGWGALTGQSEADARGWGWTQRIHPDDLPAAQSAWDRAARDGVPYEIELRVLTAAGEYLEMEDRGVPVRDDEGRLIEWVGTIADVTDRRRTERALRESEARFRAMADGLPLIVWVHDAQGAQQFVNETFCRFFGVSQEEARGGRWQALLHPEDADAYQAAFFACLHTRTPFKAEARVRDALGRWRCIESWGQPRFAAGGEFLGFVGTSVDITERKEAEAALQGYAQQLKAVDQRKDEFLAMLAHELRNPLAPLGNAVNIMKIRTGAVPPELIAMMERQLGHLVRLVDDLLDLSRVSRGKIRLKSEPIELGQVVDAAVEACRPLLEAHGHRLTIERSETSLPVLGDGARLTQVLVNLLNNAAKYTDDGGAIVIDCSAENGEAVIRVRDTGRGISAELLPHVFDLFTQADRTLDRSDGGLGLGLTLVKRLVELHGGSVGAASDGLGRGSEFTIRLPLGAEVAALSAQGDDAPPAAKTGSRRVLVVDDNTDAARSLSLLLELWGHHVTVAANGREALECIARSRPEVVLLDIGLPDLNGYEVARRVRERFDRASIRLVAVTAYGQRADRQRAREAGFDEYLTKPVPPERLRNALAVAAFGGA